MNGLFLRDKASRGQLRVIYECPAIRICQDNYGLAAEDKYSVCLEQADDKNVLVRQIVIIQLCRLLILSCHHSNCGSLQHTTR